MAVTIEDVEKLEFSQAGRLTITPDLDEVFVKKLRTSLARGREYLLSRQKLVRFQAEESTEKGPKVVELVLLDAFLAFSDPGLEKRPLIADVGVSSELISLLRTTDCLDTAIMAYFALKLHGYDPGMEFMHLARLRIAELGGPNGASETTKLLLALFGQMPFPQITRSKKRKNPAIALLATLQPQRRISPMLGVKELFRESPKKSCGKSIFDRIFHQRALKTAESNFWNNLKSTNPPVFWDKIALLGLGQYEKYLETIENCVSKPRFSTKSPQQHNGSWNSDLGETCGILTGLLEHGTSPDDLSVTSALNWILAEQNLDGGWGENADPSNPKMTARSLLTLLEAGIHDHPGVYRGVKYLLDVQEVKGNWTNRSGDESSGIDFETSLLVLATIERYTANLKIADFEISLGKKSCPARPNLRLFAPETPEKSNVQIRNDQLNRSDFDEKVRLRLFSPPGLERSEAPRPEKSRLRIFRG